jgi:hypothetical protein
MLAYKRLRHDAGGKPGEKGARMTNRSHEADVEFIRALAELLSENDL